MKTLLKPILFILAALFLSACGGNVDATPTESDSVAEAYTAVAMTVAAQDSLATPTITFLPSATPAVLSSPTLVASTPTSQSLSSDSSSSYSTAYGCNNAAYVSDVTIADGTVLAPGETFVKTWEFQNTGSCDWSENFWITFSSGEDLNGNDTEIGEDVSAGDTASISVSLVAPDEEGTYTGYWQLSTENGTVFGARVFVLIIVSDEAATSTPTATATEVTSETETSTTEPTAANTPEPTHTDTPMPAGTFTPVPTEGATDEPGDSFIG